VTGLLAEEHCLPELTGAISAHILAGFLLIFKVFEAFLTPDKELFSLYRAYCEALQGVYSA